VLQDYGIKDRASAMHWRSLISATFVYTNRSSCYIIYIAEAQSIGSTMTNQR
jgi:hypothetical protein